MSEEEKWGEFERIASCEHEPSHKVDGLLFLVCEDIRDRILALSRAASAGRELRAKCQWSSSWSNDLSDVKEDGARHFENYKSEYRVSGSAIEQYDLATSPSGNSSGDGGEVG